MTLNQNAKSMLAVLALVGAIIVALNGVILPAGGRDMFPLSLGLLAAALLIWIWLRRDARDQASDEALKAAQDAAAEAESLAKRREVRRDVVPAAGVEPDAAASKTRSKESDDLTILWGIGPDYQRILYEADIRTFADLAAMSKEELEGVFPGRLPSMYDTLPKQAHLAAAGDWESLKALQDSL